MKKTLFTVCLFFVYIGLFAQLTPASFQYVGHKLPYQIIYPDNYDSTKRYPLIVFLHGAGERGNDNEKQMIHGKQFFLDNFKANYPAIVIAPQCPAADYWSNVQRNEIAGKSQFVFGVTDKPTHSMETVIGLINWWLSSGLVDTDRVYAGGLSMGGMGTFELLWRMPNTFAAAFPICGGSSYDKMSIYAKNTAVWIFHGDADDVVPPDFSRNAFRKLKELDCDVKYTEYPGVNHGSWHNAFAEKDLVSWLFSHKKSN